MSDIDTEIKFKTARSGGKGGQHVNKVETMVEGYWHVMNSRFYSTEEKERIIQKLSGRINADGMLVIKSQADRTQLGNKEIVVKKMNLLVAKALIIPKKRKPTKTPKAVIEKRIDNKKKSAAKKEARKKIRSHE